MGSSSSDAIAVSARADRASAAGLARDHRPLLWGLCYRMTGCAADADDLVQDTLLRALERPPARADEPMRPWLVRVAMNLSRDLLRRRRRRAYVGPWLPSPIETPEQEPAAFEIAGEGGTEGRYDLLESVSFAFLLALEALTPQQRAVLLLRDVIDYSVRETAGALGISEANVKVTLHRARAKMAAYDKTPRRPRREIAGATRAALERFLAGLVHDDVVAMQAALAASIRALNDGGGEFFAARVPIDGRGKVIRFLRNSALRHPPHRVAIRVLNGTPAIVVEVPPARGFASRIVTLVDLAPDGRIATLYSVLATRKLTAIDWSL